MKTDKSDFWSNVGAGIAVFLLCMGIGGCSVLWSYSDKLDAEAHVIKQSINK